MTRKFTSRIKTLTRASNAAPALLLCFLLIAIPVTIFTVPPGAAPDETAHYLKAVGAGRGDLILNDGPAPLTGPTDTKLQKAVAWLRRQARFVSVPPRYSPEPFSCWGAPAFVGTCDKKVPQQNKPLEIETYVGRYPPYTYVAPGLAMRLAGNSTAALITGRFAESIGSILLLGFAIWILWDRDNYLSLVGLLMAVTPMVIFLTSTLSSSSVETAAGICFTACLLRMSRGPDQPRWIWIATATSGVLLAITRELGVWWLALDGLVFAGLMGFKPLLELFKAQQRRAIRTLVVLGSSVVAALIWQATQMIRPPIHPSELFPVMKAAIAVLPEFLRQAIGVFGPLDTPLPRGTYRVWNILLGALLLPAIVLGSFRQKVVLLFTIGVAILVALALDAVQQAVGFGVQARHFLPFLVTAPLVAGEIVYRNRHKLRGLAPLIPLVFGAGVALVQFWAWFTLARRFAVGLHGPLNFYERSAWSPPLGWAPWGLAMLLACFCLFLSAWIGPVQRLLGRRQASGA